MSIATTLTDFCPQEPLSISAPFAREIAVATCRQDQHGHSCHPYHGFWQYMRLMGLGKTMSGLSSAFVAAIREVAQAWGSAQAHQDRRALISGCADYSAFAHVLAGCKGLAARPRITALDLCETPLILTRWYAHRHGWPVETVCSNVLDYKSDRKYDLILTSSFLGYFSPQQRPALFANYAGLLTPGGVLLFTNRLRPEPEDQLVGFSSAQIEVFSERASQLSARLPSEAALSNDDARTLAIAYARRFATYSVNSEATLRGLAERAGLHWLGGGRQQTRALQSGVSGPTLGDGSPYVFAKLQKPVSGCG